MRQRKHLAPRLIAAVAAALVFALAIPTSANALARTDKDMGATETKSEFRALWVDAFAEGLYTPAQIDKVVQSAVDANLNALVAHVVWAGDCLCNKSILPRADIGLAPAPFDPLEYIVERGHDAGLEVHAWINSSTAGRVSPPTNDPEHVFNQHGPGATGDDYWLSERPDGETRGGNYYFLDFGHPGAVDFMVDIFTSIAANYDVDGVNIDRVRMPTPNAPERFVPSWGYNPVAVRRFQAATERNDVPEQDDTTWKDWRRDQITNLVRRIYLGVHEVKPDVVVSADTIVWGPPPAELGGWKQAQPYDVALQDWRGWLEEGILDLSMPMLYLPHHDDQARAQFEGWTEFIKDHQYGRQAAIGVGLYENHISGTIEQLRNSLAPSAQGNLAAGWVGYSWRNPDLLALNGERSRDESRAELIRALTAPSAPFENEAEVPEMTWKTQPSDGHVVGALELRKGSGLDQVTVTLDPLFGGEGITHTTDGSGWFGFAHVEPGLYLVEAELPDGVVGQPVAFARVEAGETATVKFHGLTDIS